MTDVEVEWQSLCKEFEAARKAFFRAFTPVNQKFTAIFQGTSRTNPSEEDLSEMEAAWERWQSVRRRMVEFVKVHVYQQQ
jgi:hypothetical protein